MNKIMCKYFSVCLMSGEGCGAEEIGECGEFARKEKISQEFCPIMISRGYTGEASLCDMVFLKALLPPDVQCHKNGKCIRFFIPIMSKVFQDTVSGKMCQKAELLKIIMELKEKLRPESVALKI